MPEQITADQVRMVYRAVLGREVESDAVVEGFAKLPVTLEEFIKNAILSREFSVKYAQLPRSTHMAPGYDQHNGPNYLLPRDLRVEAALPPRVLLVGSCFLDFVRAVSDHPSGSRRHRCAASRHAS